MTQNPYVTLAAVLDKMPNGYPSVEDGTHLRVLQWIFTPAEAELASRMKAKGETAQEIGDRLHISPEELAKRLEVMAEKGQIRAWNSSTGRRYALLVFIGGVWENQMERGDREFAELCEDYFRKGHLRGLFDTEPPIFRVIPINRAILPQLEVYPFEVAENMLEQAKSWGLRECACKKQKAKVGEPCKYPVSVCLNFSPKKENAFAGDPLTRTITKDEALRILHEAEEAGLVHCSLDAKTDHTYICNCCTCCCTMLRGAVEWGQPHAFIRSNYRSEVDRELCTGCGSCTEWCQFHALNVTDDVCTVDTSLCVGCGVCSIHCPEGALAIGQRPEAERNEPPASYEEWMTRKIAARGVDPSSLL